MRLFGGPAKRREKVFGEGRAIPLDRNAKARIWAYALGYTARMRQAGQHRGPLSRATLDVLRSLLWGFHNAHSGRCFPSYERIAEAACVSRATVARAIEALEAACVMTWENRLIRQHVSVQGLLGRSSILVPRRTSNAYRFRDPEPPALPLFPKSQNSTGTRIQDFSKSVIAEEITLDPTNKLHAALLKLKTAMAEQPIG
jgi:hypothetical protein